MKKIKLLALCLASLLLLSACNSGNTEETETDTLVETEATDTTSDADTENNGEDEGVENGETPKTLTDTDTPDKTRRLTLSYESYDKLGLTYANGTLGALYDGNINSRLEYTTPEGKTTYNTAKLTSPSAICFVKIFCSIGYERNVGAELQGSADGTSYTTLYTLTSTDAEAMKNAPLVVEITDTTVYSYFRVYHKDSTGYDLNEIELYGPDPNDSFFGSYVAVSPTYDSADTLGTTYIYGDKAGDADGLKLLWDKDDATRICYYPWVGGTSFNTARFEKATVIAKVRLVSMANQERNEGVQIRASQDGDEWTTLYTLTAEDAQTLKTNTVLEVEMPESATPYWFIQVYHENSNMGYDFNSLDVYTGSKYLNAGDGMTPPAATVKYSKVTATYHSFGDGAGGQKTNYIYGADVNGTNMNGNPEALKFIFDGVTDTAYVQYFNWDNAGSYLTATLPEGTVISKLTLATIWQPTRNLGTAIQASVDGEDWTTLYTLSEADGSFVAGANEWVLETFDIYVEDSTAYNYIRVYDTVGNGYCFAEIEIYTVI